MSLANIINKTYCICGGRLKKKINFGKLTKIGPNCQIWSKWPKAPKGPQKAQKAPKYPPSPPKQLPKTSQKPFLGVPKDSF